MISNFIETTHHSWTTFQYQTTIKHYKQIILNLYLKALLLVKFFFLLLILLVDLIIENEQQNWWLELVS